MLIPRLNRLIAPANLVLLLILGVSLFLRLYNLEGYPGQINQDELSNMYDGYCLAETGADRWGNRYPMVLRAFGHPDHRPPGYAWLAALSIKVLGYSIYAGRLPSVILGVLSLLLVYGTGKKLRGTFFGLLALFIACLSPWHLLFSRMAHEGAMLHAFFVILNFFLWLKTKETGFARKEVVLLGFCLGLATNAYQAGKLVFLLFAILVFAGNFPDYRRRWRELLLFGIACGIGALPQLLVALRQPAAFFARADETLIPFTYSLAYGQQVLQNFWAHLSPEFLFFSFGDYNNLTVGRLLKAEWLFFYLGFFTLPFILPKGQKAYAGFLYLLLVITILPSALTQTLGQAHALRASGVILLLPFFSAAGLCWLWQALRPMPARHLLLGLVGGAFILNLCFYIRDYIRSPHLQQIGHQHFLVQIAREVNARQAAYDRIVFEDIGNQPHIYFVHYCKMKPAQFRQAEKSIYLDNGWDHFSRLGPFYFLTRKAVEAATRKAGANELFVVQSQLPGLRLLKTLKTQRATFYFYDHGLKGE